MDLAKIGQFSLNIKPFGEVHFISLTTDLTDTFLENIKEVKLSSKEIPRWLFEKMARKTESPNFKDVDIIQGASFDAEELATVSDAGLEAFAERFMQVNQYLLRKPHGDSLKKPSEQTHCDFLIAAIEHYKSESRGRIDQTLKSASKSLFSPSTYEQIRKNQDASNLFEQTIKRYQGQTSLMKFAKTSPPFSPGLYHETKNPILETNSILQDLNSQINDMRPLVVQGADLIRSMNQTAIRMQEDYLHNADKSDVQTRIAIWIATISLCISAIGLIKGCADAQEEEKKNAVLQQNLESAVERLVAAEKQSSSVIAAAIKRVGKHLEKKK